MVKGTSREGGGGKVGEPSPRAARRRSRLGITQPVHLPTADPGLTGSSEVSTTVGLGFKELFVRMMNLAGISPAEAVRRGMWMVLREVVRDLRATIAVLEKTERREAAMA
jgi:hypothetical protein